MTALLIVLIILSALILVLLCYLIFKKQTGTADEKALRRLEEKTDAIGNLTDYNGRAVDNLNRATEARLNHIQTRLAEDMKYIVDANARNLERIRHTVDEKLTASLDGKLSDSYALISERLEKMYQSVGEMKSLADNVSDIKRVFSNVKLRGTWGEAQLSTLLGQMLSPEQYGASVKLNPLDNSLVDFAVLLPSKDGETVYLPIDSKFPVEEYLRLCEASEQGNKTLEEQARKNLERAVRLQAESISKKYILPPTTTDFAVMYLPIEGLYAEVLRMDGLSGALTRARVVACGPSTLGALLSVIQTGFRTAAIEKRSGELRVLLAQFRRDFEKFTDLLEKTSKKLQEAQDSIDGASKRGQLIERRLSSFNSLTGSDEDTTT
ncbi:MAG: DNA recombination protein RmuC [Clostridia bacterium]|nr:DNA recombination protein RmuC [Clostridia bacterium]